MYKQTIKKVAVIGGGPSGLALVKALNGQSCRFEIDLYDSRSKLGGIWNYSIDKEKYDSDEAIVKNKENNFTPIYNYLETNIPHKAMEFSNFRFPEGTVDFPFRTVVLDYIARYADSVGPCAKYLDTKVTNVEKTTQWDVTIQDLTTGISQTKQYDAVIVANGHFEVPRIPEVEGLEEWKIKDPHSITHAKFFNTPDVYKNETVLVVGGVSSGSDIAVQISLEAKTVFVSCDETSLLNKIENKYLKIIPRIDSYDVANRSVTFGTTTVEGIDKIIFCTGYLYDVPFLKSNICQKRYIRDLYKHIFYINDPTLVFVGLGKDVAPFPLAEAQAGVIARFFSGRLTLPPVEQMEDMSKDELKEKGVKLHALKFPKEAEYVNDLHKMIEDQGLQDGFMFDKYEGERYDIRKHGSEMKLQRVIENNKKILLARESE